MGTEPALERQARMEKIIENQFDLVATTLNENHLEEVIGMLYACHELWITYGQTTVYQAWKRRVKIAIDGLENDPLSLEKEYLLIRFDTLPD